MAEMGCLATLNRQVVGSIPTASTIRINQLGRFTSTLSSDTAENTANPTSIPAPLKLHSTPLFIQREVREPVRCFVMDGRLTEGQMAGTSD